LIYEEEDLVKRAIRDMFDKELEGIYVEGEAGYREARDFMRMIMPSQAKKIIHYRDPTPLFVQAKVEDLLAQIYSPVVPLKSGGYLVINQTEALVAVDVNSGKSTRERNIEATALKTNLEAAEEAARQLRLRDLAGLIVIDFIDMDEAKNNRAVEKKLKDALKDDRARIQMGKISGFGLMEISRQRRRTGVLEGTTHVCEHCAGTGRVRSTESSALAAIRAIEMEAVRGGGGALILRVSSAIGLYILNEKRAYLERTLRIHGLFVTVAIDDALAHADHAIERTETREHIAPPADVQALAFPEPAADTYVDVDEDEDEDDRDLETEIEQEDTDDDHAAGLAQQADAGEGSGGRRRRRRRRGRRGDEPVERAANAEASEGDEEVDDDGETGEDDGREGLDSQGRRRRRRGRRGGRRMRDEVARDDPYAWSRPRVPDGDPYIWMDPATLTARPAAPAPEPRPAAEARPAPEPAVPAELQPAPVAANLDSAEEVWVELPAIAEPTPKPARARRSRSKAKAEVEVEAVSAPASEPAQAEAAPEAPVAAERVVEAAEIAEIGSPPAIQPEPALAPEPVAVQVPDAAEISNPPVQPKRGWWRRNG
jgi:ribonuclease E